MRTQWAVKHLLLAVIVASLTIFPLGVHANAPDRRSHAVQLEVSDQRVVNGTVTIASVFSHGPGYIVIYGDYQGSPARAAGHAWVDAGWNYNVEVPINMAHNLSKAYVILHGDSGQVGVYEFGMAWGADAPALVGGIPITAAFRTYYPAIRM